MCHLIYLPDVYSGVMIGASCTYISGERKLDCRNYTYLYSERDGTLAAHARHGLTIPYHHRLVSLASQTVRRTFRGRRRNVGATNRIAV